MEKIYNIYKKTPASRFIIHERMGEDSVKDFMKAMSEGGYDESGDEAWLGEDGMTAGYMDRGDYISFFASEIEEENEEENE